MDIHGGSVGVGDIFFKSMDEARTRKRQHMIFGVWPGIQEEANRKDSDQLAAMLDVKLYEQDGWTNTKTKATTLGFLYPDDGDSYVEHFKIVGLYTQELINTYENRRASSGERFGKSYPVRFHRDLCYHLKRHISYWHNQILFFPDLPDLPELLDLRCHNNHTMPD